MVGHALWLQKCSNHFHEDDGQYLATIHQSFCSDVFGWHSHLQKDLGRTLATYSIGFAHPVVAQDIHQLGKIIAFDMDIVHYLGYIVDHHGVHVDLAKIQVIRD
jgi:hypothetical protein